MQTRLIHQTGVRLKLRRYWGDTSNGQRPCPGTIGKSFGYHNAELHLEDRVIPASATATTSARARNISKAASRPIRTLAGR
jgi:hypothetical protein